MLNASDVAQGLFRVHWRHLEATLLALSCGGTKLISQGWALR